jgi:F0F1-type ATP synthase assembly protein I
VSLPSNGPDPKQLGYYLEIAQVGTEMVAPIGLGIVADVYLGWAPWGALVGAVVGLVVGLVHLVAIRNRQQGAGPPKSRRDAP